MSVNSVQRFTAGRPCPVCGGYEGAERGNGSRCYGFFSDDGRYAHCARDEYAGDIERIESSNTYTHYLGGRCKCGETHDTVKLVSSEATNGHKRKGEKKQAFFDPARDTVFYYRDLANKPLYAVVRIGGDKSKTFQAHKDGDKWYRGIPKDAPNVPYRLPEVVQAIAEGKDVHYFEGEPDANAARDLGLVATTNLRGAGNITADIVPYFRGANVVVNGDNDADGDKHRQKTPAMLHRTAASIKVMPPFPGVKDFRDWIEAGGTVEEYLEMVKEAPEYDPARDAPATPQTTSQLHSPYISDEVMKLVPRPPLVVKRFKDIPYPGPRTDVVEDLIPEKEPTTVHGAGGTTKSYLGLDLLLSLATGQPDWLGHRIGSPKTTLYVDLELSEAEQVRRAHRVAAGKGYAELPDGFLHLAARGYTPHEVFTAVYKDCDERGTEVVLVDSVGLALIAVVC